MRWYTGYLLVVMLCLGQSVAAQTRPVDSTTFFPLGLWGIWIDWNNDAPRLGGFPDWSQEDQNFTDIHANYMVDHIPEHIEDDLLDHVSPLGYRINISRQPMVTGRTDSCSLHRWCVLADSIPMSLDTVTITDGWDWQDWRAEADRRISSLLHIYGDNPNVLTFYAGHETEICPDNVALRPFRQLAYKYVCEQWNARCSDPTKKLYFVLGPVPGWDFGAFLDIVPTRMWCFEPGYQFRPQATVTNTIQQQELDVLTTNLDYAREVFRYRPVEMWACLQSHMCDTGAHQMRYPNPSEIRAEGYLSLSRGAKGLNWFVYGSLMTYNGGDSYKGLVNYQRAPRQGPESDTLFKAVAALHLELASLTPTLRTLFVRDGLTSQQAAPANGAGIRRIYGTRMEAGTFKKFYWGDATDYVMLVNRRLNDDNGVLTDPDTVRMVMNSGRFFTRDVRTGMVSFGTWYPSGDSTAFKDTLDAGWGELYHVKRCLQGVQDTSSRLHELEIVTGTWTIDSGATVTATPGTTVIFQPGTKIVVRNGGRLVVDYGANIDLRNGIIECEGSGAQASILISDSIGLTGSGEIRGGRIEWANGWMVRRPDTLRFTGGAKLDFTCDTVVHLDTKALWYGTVLFKGSEQPYEFGVCLDTIIVGAWDGLFASRTEVDTGAFLLHLPYVHCVPNASISSKGTLDSGCLLHFRDTVQCLVTGHIDAEYTEFAKSELSPAGSVGWEGLIVAYGSSQVQLDECVIKDIRTSASSNPGYALHLYHSPNQANSMKHTRIVRYLETVYDTARGIAVFLQGDSATASYLNMECNEIGNAWASGVTTSRSTFKMLRNLVDGNYIGVEESSYSTGRFFENTVRNAKNADLYWPTGIGISLHASIGWLGDTEYGHGVLGKNKVTNNDYRQLQADFGAHLWAGAKNQSRAVAGRNQITSGNGALRLWVDSVGTVVEACSDWWGVLPDSIDQYGNCALTKAQKDTLVYCSIKSNLDLSSARCDTNGSTPGDCAIASRNLFSTPPFAKEGGAVANIPAQSVFDLPDIAAAGNFSEIYRFVAAVFTNPSMEHNRVLAVLSTVLQLEREHLAEYPDSAGRIEARFSDFCNTQYGRASNTTIRAGLLYYLGALHSLTGDLSNSDAAIGELHNIAPATAYATNAHMLSFGNALSRNDTLTANTILSLMRANGTSASELRIAEAMKYGYLRVPRRNSIPSLRKRAGVSTESHSNERNVASSIEVHASPDPFGAHVFFHYRIEEETMVRFVLYSALGEEIEVLHDGRQRAGEHQVRFTAAPALPNGVYYYVINTGYGSASGKVRLVR